MGNPDSSPLITYPRQRPRYGLRRLAVLLVLLLPVGFWKAWDFYQHDVPLTPEAPAPRVEPKKPVYVLILGVDERRQDVGRSDTLLLLRMGVARNRVDLISIPRDTQVTYPDGVSRKVNAAYPMKGPDLAIQVVGSLLDINGQIYYVKVNLEAFERIVDKLGGVEIDVDRHYRYSDPYQDLEIDIKPGRQQMDGETALKYVRVRYDGVTNDDIARIKRQQQFLESMRAKVSPPAAWVKIPDVISTTRQYLKTNIPESDQIALAESLFKARGNINMVTLPGNPDDLTGDWIMDSARWSEVVREWENR